MSTVLESLNGALHELMASDPRVMVIGEDILDPYGGAFKVTRGLSSAYADRVFTTPISEAAFLSPLAVYLRTTSSSTFTHCRTRRPRPSSLPPIYRLPHTCVICTLT